MNNSDSPPGPCFPLRLTPAIQAASERPLHWPKPSEVNGAGLEEMSFALEDNYDWMIYLNAYSSPRHLAAAQT